MERAAECGRNSRARVAQASRRRARRDRPPVAALRARRKFLRFFPRAFRDETYFEYERGYKWAAHQRFEAELARESFRALSADGRFRDIADRAVRIESQTNLLFSFEKM